MNTTNRVKETLTKQDYKDALDVQNACNLSGVVFSYARVMRKICNEADALGKGTDWKNTHPISVMYASKIVTLTGCGCEPNFSEAYDAVRAVIEG